jgi:26S proteasome regulatory subunit N2
MAMAAAPSSLPIASSTATGCIALLQESDLELQKHALQKLLACVDVLWHEVAECLPQLESLAESNSVPLEVKQTAAAVASRVFFHLDEPNSALRLALEAGPAHFEWDPSRSKVASPYVERLVAAALDAYIQARQAEAEDAVTMKDNDNQQQLSVEQLQPMVYRLLETSCQAGHFEHALGLALEARETEQVRAILQKSGPSEELLKYALKATSTVVTLKSFRLQALQVVAECLQAQFDKGLIAAAYDLVLSYQLLNESTQVAKVLEKLLKGSEHDYLLNLQLAFDLMDSGDQAFVKSVAQHLNAASNESAGEEFKARLEQTNRVLLGGFSSELALSFLHKHSKADKLIMETLKKSMEERSSGSRSSILHHAAVMTHGYLYAGTTNDSFLRDNLEWMKKASNWYVRKRMDTVCIYSIF